MKSAARKLFFGKVKKEAACSTLLNGFTEVPHPNGDFIPCSNLAPANDVQITPYGYLVTGTDPYFFVKDLPDGSDVALKASISFTSFNTPLTAEMYFDYGDGFSETHKVPLLQVDIGRLEIIVPVESGLKSIRLDFGELRRIFTVHDLTLEFVSVDELAKRVQPPAPSLADIYCFPVIDWAFRFQRPQQLLSCLAKKGHRVFYLQTQFSGFASNQVSISTIDHNIFSIQLPGNPRLNIYKDRVSANTLCRGLNALSDFMIEQGSFNAVSLLHLPFWLPYTEALRDRHDMSIIYDCMDDHSGFENNEAGMLELEHQAVIRSDRLITTSSLLYEKFSHMNENCSLIRNACNYDHFSKVELRVPEFLENETRPIVGYYGALAEWFDVEALEIALKDHPDWLFVLIGHVHEQKVAALDRYDNLLLLGELPYDKLPAIASKFNVCTIPFRRIPLTEATNPVKIFEYFASGTPVVARDLPELEPYRDVTYLYKEPHQFSKLLEKAMEEDCPSSLRKRKEIAAENTWDRRASEFEEAILSDNHKASIVVVSYNSLSYLHQCLTSIFENTVYPHYEVVVVDNGSNDAVVSYLERLEHRISNLRVIFNSENRGFAAANNQGIEACSEAEYFVLLNNDTVVPKGWLTRLVHYAQKEDIGLVGPVTNSIGNEAQIPVTYKSMSELPGFAKYQMSQYRGESIDINVLAMFCVAFRREVLDRVGLLDEDFSVGMFEDDDYAQRVRKNGYRVVCVEDVFVHHYGSVSFSKIESKEYQAIFEKNKQVYERKWGEWVPHVYR